MTVPPDALIIRGGTMTRDNLDANITDVFEYYGRHGLCIMVLVDQEVELAGPHLVPHGKLCLSTPLLLEEGGIEPLIDATNDQDNRYQHTLWLPDEAPGILVNKLWTAFRGPIVKGDASSDWTTDDLRRLHRPGP